MAKKKAKIITYQPAADGRPGMQEKFARSNVDCAWAGGVLNPQPLTSSILTPTGFRKISEVKAGDEVCGLGTPTQTIVHYELEGLKDCVRIVLEDGSSAESAMDHKWWVRKDGYDTNAIAWELLESFQVAREKGVDYEVYGMRFLNGSPVPVRIREVIDIGKQEVACIGVSNDDELYITDDYLITKNCGKAQPYSSSVLTPNGFVRICDLEEGDEVCDPSGGIQTVEAIYEQGVQDVYRVEFEYGYADCTLDHLWMVRDQEDHRIRLMELKELMLLDYHRWSVFTPRELTLYADDMRSGEIPPYVLGRCLGKTSPYDSDISREMSMKLRALGITDKWFIPSRYGMGTIETRTDLLRGFIDEKSQGKADVSLKYRKVLLPGYLVSDIANLVFSLGGTVYVREPDDPSLIQRGYMEMKIICRAMEKYYSPTAVSYTRGEQSVQRYIKNIYYVGRDRCRCIRVSGTAHLYVTDYFIVTHNTYAAILMVGESSLDPAFRGAFTRRNLGNLKQGGGIVDDFKNAYGDYVKATTSDNPRIQFPSGAFVDCLHIANEEPLSLMERAKGWQYDLFYLDELTSYQFTTFSIVGTRCRGKAKWTGKIRATTNPKRSHWSRKMLDWYIGEDGFILPERDGVVRYYYQMGDKVEDIIFGDTPEEVYLQCKPDIDQKLKRLGGSQWTYKDMIRTFVFYSGKMSENKASIGTNSHYIGSVAAVGGRRAQQLIEGNFNVDEDEDENIPISSSDAQAVFTNDACTNGDEWITVDLADVGNDNLVALHWNGFHCDDIMIISDSTPRSNFEKIKLFATKHNIPDTHIIYDATHGTYMYDYMPMAIPFISAGSPIGLYALMSDRLKDECYLRLCDAITNHRMSFSSKVARTRYVHKGISEELTVQAEFLQECSVVRMRETPRGKMKLLSKKEMNQQLGRGRSMDLLDPCAMRMYPVLGINYGEELSKTAISQDREKEVQGTFNVFDESNWC